MLANMRVAEQIDVIESLSIDSFKLLVVPRVIACVIALPLLTLFMDFAAPGGTGPYRLEGGADGQPVAEPASGVEERSPVEVPVVIRRILTVHDRSSFEGWTPGEAGV